MEHERWLMRGEGSWRAEVGGRREWGELENWMAKAKKANNRDRRKCCATGDRCEGRQWQPGNHWKLSSAPEAPQPGLSTKQKSLSVSVRSPSGSFETFETSSHLQRQTRGWPWQVIWREGPPSICEPYIGVPAVHELDVVEELKQSPGSRGKIETF